MQYIRRQKSPSPDRAAGQFEQPLTQSVEITAPSRRVSSRFMASPLTIVYFFLAIIAVGTLLLLPPFTNRTGEVTPLVVALFTSTSAITCTGLVVQDTAQYWTRAGQIIILGMIYLGGLGFMTIATFLLILMGQRVTLTQRLLMRENLMLDQFGSMARLTVGIVIVATGIQVVGFVALLAYFYMFSYPPADAVWQAAFHSVSAFNGAGFLVFKEVEGLLAYRTDAFVLSVIALLIFIGAISYLVIIDVARVRRFSRFALNTKIALIATLLLTVVGAVGFFALEYGNPETMGDMSVGEKAMAAAFQAVSGRTAGFTIADLSAAGDTTNALTSSLMFVGGASASVAGGVKVNTLAVVAIAVIALLRQRNHTSAFGREIPASQVQRAFLILVMSLLFVFVVILILSVTERGLGFLDILFETASAFGTVGLSTGITPLLSDYGRLIIAATMFIGKLGPLTIGLTMAYRPEQDLYRYAQERVTIG